MMKTTTAVRRLASSQELQEAFCELTITRPETLETALRLWAGDRAWKLHEIPKSHGGTRTIHAPAESVKELLRSVLAHVVQRLLVHRCVHGAHPKTSIITNARRHAGFARAVFNVDLRDAFPSCTATRLEQVVLPNLVQLVEQSIEEDAETSAALAEILLVLCLVDDRLPQGFPTSPGLLNAALYPVDRAIGAYLRELSAQTKQRYRLTRYVDDITVSTDGGGIDKNHRREILRIIRSHGWKINRRKVHYFGAGAVGDDERSTRTPTVTGLVVHDDGRVTIHRWKLDRWRGYLHKVCTQEEVGQEDRERVAGIIGFVGMVYDEAVPAVIRKPYAAAKARFAGGGRAREIASGEIDPLGDEDAEAG